MGGRIVRPEQGQSLLELPEVGRLHIGMKQKKPIRQRIPGFRGLLHSIRKVCGVFTNAIGEKPSTIQIVFPDDDPEKVCNERYEYRDDRGALVARGDGKIFEVWDGKRYAPFSIDQYPDIMNQITAKNPTKRGTENWDVTLTLRFVIPAVRGVVGVWQFATKGKASSIKNIRNSFDGVQMMRGTVLGTVFDLSVQFAKSNKPGDNSRYPVVSLIANDNRVSEIREAIQQKENLSLLLPNNNPVKNGLEQKD